MHHDHTPHAAAPLPHTGEFVFRRVTSLDAWLAHAWDRGVRTDQIDALETLHVQTRNSAYELAVVAGAEGRMLVRGGRYFPEWTAVSYLGCSLGGALLMRHVVHPGFRMEFYSGGRRIVTSPVRGVRRDAATRPSAVS